MTPVRQHRRVLQRAAAVVAALFGLATIASGGRVLAGWSDVEYVVFRPLLIFNTIMGVAYCAAAVTIWRSVHWGRRAAEAIVVLNLVVLGSLILLYKSGGAVAIDSLGAMAFRTVGWLGLLAGLVWRSRRAARMNP